MLKSILLISAICIFSGSAFAEKAESPEDREKMAAAHEKMAVCLRSDKSLKDCHEEFKKAHAGDKSCCLMKGKKNHHHEEEENKEEK